MSIYSEVDRDIMETETGELVKLCFEIGFNNKEILSILAQKHNIMISITKLRWCREDCLFRRRSQTEFVEAALFVQNWIASHEQMQGYQWLHLRAIQKGYVVSQDKVRQLLS